VPGSKFTHVLTQCIPKGVILLLLHDR
jgi:hypothetical protein